MTIKQRVGRMESSAVRTLRKQILASKLSIMQGFQKCDPDDTGKANYSQAALQNMFSDLFNLGFEIRVTGTQHVSGRFSSFCSS